MCLRRVRMSLWIEPLECVQVQDDTCISPVLIAISVPIIASIISG